MRDLKASDKNLMVIFDTATGSKIGYYYSSVTTEERLQFNSDFINEINKTKDIRSALEVQMNWAEKKLTGFREGDYCYDGKPISSDPENSNHYAGWKQLIRENDSDKLLSIAKILFGEPSFVIKEDSPNFFSKNSNGITMPGQRKKRNTIKKSRSIRTSS